MRAYLLVQFNADADLSRAQHALNQPGVERVDLVLGPYDAVVTVAANDFAELSQLAQRVRGCPGIRSSITCPITES